MGEERGGGTQVKIPALEEVTSPLQVLQSLFWSKSWYFSSALQSRSIFADAPKGGWESPSALSELLPGLSLTVPPTSLEKCQPPQGHRTLLAAFALGLISGKGHSKCHLSAGTVTGTRCTKDNRKRDSRDKAAFGLSPPLLLCAAMKKGSGKVKPERAFWIQIT